MAGQLPPAIFDHSPVIEGVMKDLRIGLIGYGFMGRATPTHTGG